MNDLKKIRSGVLVVLAVLVLLTTLTSSAAEFNSRPVRVGFFPFPGFHMVDERGHRSGYGYDYLQCLLPYTSWYYEYTDSSLDWPFMLPLLEAGKIDLVASVQKTPEREEKFAFSKYPLGVTMLVMTVRSGSTGFLSGDYAHWNGIRVGMIRGNIHNRNFEELARNKGFVFTPVYYDSMQKMIRDLHEGKEINATFSSDLRNMQGETVYEKVSAVPFYIAMRKDNTRLLNEVNAAMEQLESQAPQLQKDLWNRYYERRNSGGIMLSAEEKEFVEQHKTFTAVINPDRMPLSFLDQNGKPAGPIKEIADEIIKKSGLSIHFIPLTSRKEYMDACADPKVDLVFDSTQDFPNAEKSRLRLSQPYLTVSVVRLFNKAGEGVANTIVDLAGSNLNELSRQLAPEAHHVSCDTLAEAIASVSADPGRAVYLLTRTAEYAINQDVHNLLAASYTSRELKYTVGVRYHCDPRLASILCKAIGNLDSSFVDSIQKRNQLDFNRHYTFSDFVHMHPWKFFGILAVVMILTGFLLWHIIFSRKVTYRLGSLLARLPFHCFVITRDGRFLYYNFGITTGINTRFATSTFRSVTDIPGEEIRRLMHSHVAEVLDSGKTAMTEFVFHDRHRTVSVYKLPRAMFGCDTVLWLSQDVTDLYNSRAEAHKNEDFFHLTLNSVGDGIITTDTEGRILLLNHVAERMIGTTQEQAAGRPHTEVFKIVNSADMVPIDSPIYRTLRTGATVELANNTLLVSLDQTRQYHIADSTAPIHDEKGGIVGAILVFRDVTEEYQRRTAMQAEMSRWEAAADIARICPIQYTPETREVSGGHTLARLWRFRDGKPVSPEEWIYPQDLDLWQRECDVVRSGRKTETIFKFRVQDQDRMRHFRVFLYRTGTADAKISGLIQEITDYVLSLQEQTAMQELWRTCANAGPSLIFVKSVNNDFRYVQCNIKFADFLGCSIDEIADRTDAELIHRPEDIVRIREQDHAVMAGGKTMEFHETIYDGKGVARRFRTIKFPAHGAKGRPLLIGMALEEKNPA